MIFLSDHNMVEYACKKCGKKFTTKYKYERHINSKKPCNFKKFRIVHDKKSDSDIYVCGFCGQKFTLKNNLYHHIKHNCKENDGVGKKETNINNEINGKKNNIIK